jgi:hypothetical protein
MGKEHPSTLIEHEQPSDDTEESGQVRAGRRDASISTQAERD